MSYLPPMLRRVQPEPVAAFEPAFKASAHLKARLVNLEWLSVNDPDESNGGVE